MWFKFSHIVNCNCSLTVTRLSMVNMC